MDECELSVPLFKREPEFEDLEEAEPSFELFKELGPREEFKEELPLTPPSPFESFWDDFDGFRGSFPNICLIISKKNPNPNPQ